MRKASLGFSLIELMTAIAVLALLLAVGVPNFRELTRNARMTSAANELLGHVALARGEAISRRVVVSVCSGAGGADPECDDGDFRDGWIVFTDDDGDGVFDDGADELVAEHAALPAGIGGAVRQPTAADPDEWEASLASAFSYAPSGFRVVAGGALPPNLSIILCDERGNVPTAAGPDQSAGRVLDLNSIGRPSISRDIDLIDGRGGCPEA